ncbi:ISLre2 family transposase [Streptococcus agalactiae]|uniref:ISLre2 family transposase n=1 Tax=Streptococcus agalactiae TaxID=1311 RepID=UPI001E64813F|nr:ISLre2 family transposase [Streptococcus agalactiae]
MDFSEEGLLKQFREDNKQTFLQMLEQYEKEVAPAMRVKGYKRINESERTVTFSFGEITFSRSRWTNGRKTTCPIDDKLGLAPYVRYAPAFIARLASLATTLPYRQVVKAVKRDYGLVISKDAVSKSVKQARRLLKEKENYRFLKDYETVTKIKAKRIYLEGDGVMVKCSEGGDERRNIDLAHFVVHTGCEMGVGNRPILMNKKEFIHKDHSKAVEEVIDYLYNHFEITSETVLITNSDNGKGYGKRLFQEIKKAIGIPHHEHFWDAYHLNEKLKVFLKPFPSQLLDLSFKALKSHSKDVMRTVLDTCESLVETEEDEAIVTKFKSKLIRQFSQTKPAYLRGFSHKGIGIMESQHRKITYRMKHRGMYWSRAGAHTMSNLILLEFTESLSDLFTGDWRQDYEAYQDNSFSLGLTNRHIEPEGRQIHKVHHAIKSRIVLPY